jgi:hypothetical protein
MADLSPTGISRPTGALITAAVVNIYPVAGDLAVVLPAHPTVNDTVLVNNFSPTGVTAKVYPHNYNAKIDALTAGEAATVVAGASKTYTATTGTPYGWTSA